MMLSNVEFVTSYSNVNNICKNLFNKEYNEIKNIEFINSEISNNYFRVINTDDSTMITHEWDSTNDFEELDCDIFTCIIKEYDTHNFIVKFIINNYNDSLQFNWPNKILGLMVTLA